MHAEGPGLSEVLKSLNPPGRGCLHLRSNPSATVVPHPLRRRQIRRGSIFTFGGHRRAAPIPLTPSPEIHPSAAVSRSPCRPTPPPASDSARSTASSPLVCCHDLLP